MRQKTFQTRYISYVLLALTCLLTACSGGGSSSEELDPPTPDPTPNPTPENQEIKLNANVWNMMEGMRATTYDNQEAIQDEGSFTCAVFQANTTTEYISPTAVNWSASQWLFSDGKHYWPASGSLDFFAYMPKAGSLPSYITSGPTYTATASPSHDVTFTCTLDDNLKNQGNSSVKEFIYALALDQNKAGTNHSAQPNAGQVALNFQHPFARIYLKRGTIQKNGASVDKNVVWISRVTLKSVNQTGTYSYNNDSPQWTSSSSTSFTLDNVNVPTEGFGPYLVVPQTFNSTNNFEVELSYLGNWSLTETQVFSTTVNTTWEPGHSYTYTISASITVSSGGGGGGGGGGITVDVSKYTEQW